MSGGTGDQLPPVQGKEEDQAWEQVINSCRTPGSLFSPSPSREQALPRNRACGDSVWMPSQIHRAGNQPSSFVTHGRDAIYAPMEIQGNFMFAYQRTLDVFWGEDVQET